MSVSESVRRGIRKTLETVMARVYLGSDQSNLTGNAWNKINFNSVDYDNGKNYDTTNFKFVVPVTGLYSILGSIEFTSVVISKRYKVAIYKNNALVKSHTSHSAVADNITVLCLDELFLRKDDYIEIFAYPEVGVGTNTVDILSGITASTFVIRLITKEGIRQ